MIIAIDGPAAAGKGTLARRVAEKYDYAYLDTGALYRCVGLQVLRAGKMPSNMDAAVVASKMLDLSLMEDPALRDEATGGAASKVAAMPEVRSNLLDFQRNFAHFPPDGKAGAVLDGRDIGTVVCPEAAVKLFVTASPEVRAERRHKEMLEKGEAAEFAEILAEVKARDARDMGRKDAPLRPDENAHLLDTTNLGIDAVFSEACEIIDNA